MNRYAIRFPNGKFLSQRSGSLNMEHHNKGDYLYIAATPLERLIQTFDKKKDAVQYRQAMIDFANKAVERSGDSAPWYVKQVTAELKRYKGSKVVKDMGLVEVCKMVTDWR